MKKKILRIVLIFFGAILLAAGILAAIYLHRIPVVDNKYGEVIMLPTYEKVHHGYFTLILDLLEENPAKCTAVATKDENGHLIVGRNLDFNVSNKGIMLFHTKQEGLYETIGAANFAGLGDDADVIIEKGIPKWYYDLIPDMAADVMNSEGLYIEQNERMGEFDDDMKLIWACEGTNKNAEVTLSDINIPQYFCERCKNIEEAIELAKNINIYSFIGMGITTNFAYLMADATGRYGVLEIMDDKICWLEGQPISTNFYLSEEYGPKARFGQGQSRYKMVEELLPSVKNLDDMKDMMMKLTYSQYLFPDRCQYDCRYEFANEFNNWTVEDIENPDNQEELMRLIRERGDWSVGKTRAEIAEKIVYFETVYTNLVDCNDKVFRLVIRENPDKEVIWGFK